jgi:predicted ATPase
MTVVRALGVESEAELEFSALLELCWPLRERLEEISPHQAAVLRAALGLGTAAEVPERFAIGAATLALLAAAAEAEPVLVAVDDAQWLDRASRDALLFAARRLQADRVAVVIAARTGEGQPFDAAGIESLVLRGLDREAAATLVRTNATVARAVADRLYEATHGNPLALIELPGQLSARQLAGTAPLDEPLPAGSAVERAFARRAERLPADTRRALLLAAVSSSNELDAIVAGLAVAGLAEGALEPAEDAGLVRLESGRLAFRHPLVRSAVHHAASPSDRRAAHRALAEGLAGSTHVEARAWHLAGAALGTNDEAAGALEVAAEHARRRGGHAAAAAALERAARLTSSAEAAAPRLHAAADAAWRAGRTDAARALVAEALAALDGPGRADALRLLGAIEYFAGRGGAAASALLEAVRLLEPADPGAAVTAAADAVNALVRVRQPERALETARTARRLAPLDGREADLEATVALGFALCFAARFGEAP